MLKTTVEFFPYQVLVVASCLDAVPAHRDVAQKQFDWLEIYPLGGSWPHRSHARQTTRPIKAKGVCVRESTGVGMGVISTSGNPAYK